MVLNFDLNLGHGVKREEKYSKEDVAERDFKVLLEKKDTSISISRKNVTNFLWVHRATVLPKPRSSFLYPTPLRFYSLYPYFIKGI